MTYKNYDELTESDTWITDGDGCKKIRRGKNAKGISSYVTSIQNDVDYCVRAETLPETFFDNPPITRESTWDWDIHRADGSIDTKTIDTIETWEWSDELNRYDIVDLREKETGEYIPHNEEDYIQNMIEPIPA